MSDIAELHTLTQERERELTAVLSEIMAAVRPEIVGRLVDASRTQKKRDSAERRSEALCQRVALWSGGVNVYNTYFAKAPGTAVLLGGAATMNWSYIGTFGPQYATRSTAIYLTGSASAQNNWIYWAGTAAIAASGSYNLIYGNHGYQNRYEQPDHAAGGVIHTAPGSYYAVVAYNDIDEVNWRPIGTPVNGCATVPVPISGGIEVVGTQHWIYNNRVVNAAGGVQAGGSDPTSGLYITANRFSSSESLYSFENNYGGVSFPGTAEGYMYPASGLTLDHLRIGSTQTSPIRFGGGISGQGFVNGHCITSLAAPRVLMLGYNPLVNAFPASTTSCP